MRDLDRAQSLAVRGMNEQIDWLAAMEARQFVDEWLTLAEEYDRFGSCEEGDRTELYDVPESIDKEPPYARS